MATRQPESRALFVHGLWMSGHEAAWLRRCLAPAGVDLDRFAYASMRASPCEAARRLAHRMRAEPGVHLVAHSLGGLVALAALAEVPDWSGRAVLLGPPLAGSRVARRLRRAPGGALFLGAARDWLVEPPALTAPEGRVAVIAGTRNIGIGRVLAGCPGPGDGVVRVAETVLAGAARMEVRANHVELLVRPRVCAAVAAFLAGRGLSG